MQFSNIRDLREKIINTIENYIENNRFSLLKFAHEGGEFHFMKSVSFVIPTSYTAYNLADFIEIIRKVTIDAIYFHIFEARLRLEKKTNDFSNWIETSLGDKELAEELSKLDPCTRTLEDLRNTIINTIKKRFLE